MGYTTNYSGHFSVTPALTPEFDALVNQRHDENWHDCPFYFDMGKLWVEYLGSSEGKTVAIAMANFIKDFAEPYGYTVKGAVSYVGENWSDLGRIVVKDNFVYLQNCEIKWLPPKSITVSPESPDPEPLQTVS